MSRPDEGLIHQWLDGECTPEESARLEQLVATDPEWAAAVAEARGLIAASSRTVQSLDAVPLAMPKGSVAAPRNDRAARQIVRAPQRFVAKPWMRIAAAVVLVAGSAYVLRERTTEPFVPAATEADMTAPPAVNAQGAGDATRIQPPTDVPSLGPARTADRAVGAAERGSTQSAPAPVLSPEFDARKETPALAAAPPATAGSGGASTRTANIPSVAAPSAATAPPPLLLDGCWRVTAPPELVGVLKAPEIRRQRGDTLVLVTVRGDLVVVRSGDSLQGALVARAEPCSE